MSNHYCDALGIAVPRLEVAARTADANTYAMLIVALLERGEPLTLAEAAQRFEAAGIAPAGRAPGWEDPWSRAQRVVVGEREPGYRPWLVDEEGFAMDSADVQLARLAEGYSTTA